MPITNIKSALGYVIRKAVETYLELVLNDTDQVLDFANLSGDAIRTTKEIHVCHLFLLPDGEVWTLTRLYNRV